MDKSFITSRPVLSLKAYSNLLIYFLMYFPLLVRVLCLSLFCYALLMQNKTKTNKVCITLCPFKFCNHLKELLCYCCLTDVVLL